MRSYVDSLVRYVISPKVTELELDFDAFGYFPYFRLQLVAVAEAEAEDLVAIYQFRKMKFMRSMSIAGLRF